MRLSMLRLLNQVSGQIAQQPISANTTSIFLRHVKWITGKNQLDKHFSRFGKIQNIDLFWDLETGLHRGFAVVSYASSESVARVMLNKPHIIDGDMVEVQYHTPRAKLRNVVTTPKVAFQQRFQPRFPQRPAFQKRGGFQQQTTRITGANSVPIANKTERQAQTPSRISEEVNNQ